MSERLETRKPGSGARRAESPSALNSPVGERLRRERDRLGLSLRELARRLDVSPSLVSQIETGKIQPSVRTLYAIVSELGVSLDDVFELPPKADPLPPEEVTAKALEPVAAPAAEDALVPLPEVVERPDVTVSRQQRAADRRVIKLSGGVQWERLTPWNDPDVDFLFTKYEPGATSSPDGKLLRHNGREFGIVLSGRLRVTVGFEDYVLEPGDSISFNSSIPHRLATEGDEVAETVWVVIGRNADSGMGSSRSVFLDGDSLLS
ncbi:MAG TPA: cupin domain-containing protein [Gaiellaceae bacterium]|nr:cupin domain-containing protein [Gaiellaceae bacterium]